MQVWKSIKQFFARPEPVKLDLQQTTNWQDTIWQVNPIQQMHYFQVPELTQEDVERIARRDYPPDMFGLIMDLLGRYGQSEPLRVRLAILKLPTETIKGLNFIWI